MNPAPHPLETLRREIHTRVAKLAKDNALRVASDTANLVHLVQQSRWKAAALACFWLARQMEIQTEAERVLAAINQIGGHHGRRG